MLDDQELVYFSLPDRLNLRKRVRLFLKGLPIALVMSYGLQVYLMGLKGLDRYIPSFFWLINGTLQAMYMTSHLEERHASMQMGPNILVEPMIYSLYFMVSHILEIMLPVIIVLGAMAVVSFVLIVVGVTLWVYLIVATLISLVIAHYLDIPVSFSDQKFLTLTFTVFGVISFRGIAGMVLRWKKKRQRKQEELRNALQPADYVSKLPHEPTVLIESTEWVHIGLSNGDIHTFMRRGGDILYSHTSRGRDKIERMRANEEYLLVTHSDGTIAIWERRGPYVGTIYANMDDVRITKSWNTGSLRDAHWRGQDIFVLTNFGVFWLEYSRGTWNDGIKESIDDEMWGIWSIGTFREYWMCTAVEMSKDRIYVLWGQKNRWQGTLDITDIVQDVKALKTSFLSTWQDTVVVGVQEVIIVIRPPPSPEVVRSFRYSGIEGEVKNVVITDDLVYITTIDGETLFVIDIVSMTSNSMKFPKGWKIIGVDQRHAYFSHKKKLIRYKLTDLDYFQRGVDSLVLTPGG